MKTRRAKYGRSVEVYTSSLNDIMFFLLLFFLIISTMVTPASIKVLLPKSSTSQDIVSQRRVNIAIDAEGRYMVENNEVTFDGLEQALDNLHRQQTEGEDIVVVLQADQSLNLQKVVDVMDAAYKRDMRVVLMTKKK